MFIRGLACYQYYVHNIENTRSPSNQSIRMSIAFTYEDFYLRGVLSCLFNPIHVRKSWRLDSFLATADRQAQPASLKRGIQEPQELFFCFCFSDIQELLESSTYVSSLFYLQLGVQYYTM